VFAQGVGSDGAIDTGWPAGGVAVAAQLLYYAIDLLAIPKGLRLPSERI